MLRFIPPRRPSVFFCAVLVCGIPVRIGGGFLKKFLYFCCFEYFGLSGETMHIGEKPKFSFFLQIDACYYIRQLSMYSSGSHKCLQSKCRLGQ